MTDQETRDKFHKAVDNTLSGLQGDPLLAQRILHQAQQKEEPKMKRKLSVGLVIVLALALMSVTAVAAGLWGIFDYVGVHGTKLLDGAENTIQTGVPQQGGQTSVANFTLREAVLDGRAAYLVFDVIPVDKEAFLVEEDLSPDDPAAILSEDYPEDMTIAELAASMGYTKVAQVIVAEQRDENYDAPFSIDSVHGEYIEGGIMLGCTATEAVFNGTIDMAFNCYVITFEDGERNMEVVPLTATLHVDEPLWTTTNTEPVDYPEAGIRIDSVNLTGTVMAIYAEVDFTVTNQELYDSYEGGFWLEFLDENGERCPSGAVAWGSVSDPNENDGKARQLDSMQAAKEPPTTLTVRAYSAWTKERCESITINLGE